MKSESSRLQTKPHSKSPIPWLTSFSLIAGFTSFAFSQSPADAVEEVEGSPVEELLQQAREKQQAQENQPEQAQQQEPEQAPSKLDELLAQAKEAQLNPPFTPFPEIEPIPPISDGLSAPGIYEQEMPLDANDLQLMQDYQRELAKRLRSATVTIRIGGGSGSGVFVSPDGLIASAAHVTGTAGKKLTVVLPDGTELKARALTQDPSIDGSFAMVEPGELKEAAPWVEFAEMGEQEVGDWTVTCGNSGGWDADRGPVIRVGRLVRLGITGTQTDAPLIGGDSGGPIVDINGRLLGTNSRVGGTARHSLHVPLPYFYAFVDEAQDQFALANSEGVDALINFLKEDAKAKAAAQAEAEASPLDELLDQARQEQQAGPLDELLDQAREAQQNPQSPSESEE